MYRNMLHNAVLTALLTGLAGTLAACGGGGDGGSGSGGSTTGSTATLPLTLSDASSEDWSLIGVRVLSVALVPQGGGANVTVWTAPSPAPYVNLEQLDQLGEILGNVSVPAGTYTGAVLTLSANAGDVLLTVAENAESGFPVAAGTSIPSDQIIIQGKQGSSGKYTVPVAVGFVAPLVVSSTQSNALDLEFDLGNPAFIVGHTPPAAMGATLWAVNFRGPLRHHPIYDIAHLVLRHTYGSVTGVSSDNSYFTMDKDFPVLPVTSPETAITSSAVLQIQADGSNGTLFYDLDAKTTSVVKDFSAQAGTLGGKYVRVAARYQQNGTLVAVRVWASSDFNNVWVSPEGHVTHVDSSTNLIRVADESGGATTVSISPTTEFFFRTPANAQADATPIATGTGFLADQDLVRGFKVHVSVADPLATPMVATSVDIETATYSGRVSGAGSGGFTYTHNFGRATDDYSVGLDYISAGTANGMDANGNAILGFKWWDFTFPTQLDSGSSAISDFVAASSGAVNFGGSVGALSAWGASTATWADAADPSGWSLRNAILMPTPVPLGTVTTAFAGSSFAMSVAGGAQPVTVGVSTTSQSATLVYQVDRSGAVITVSPIDVTSSSGLGTLTQNLLAGVPVKVYGIPQADGTLRAYVLAYYTGMLPSM
ncbi:MAG TPA: DUF4382 domain-containing protein [Steroidobacteraceae bacterium]|nr:DUF4382 domain-containing protein [Steroidobacteraceae bacterium]